MDGTDRIGCLTSVLDLSVQLRGGISRRFLPRIFLFPVFLLLPPFVSSRREREGRGRGKFYADTSVFTLNWKRFR